VSTKNATSLLKALTRFQSKKQAIIGLYFKE
jgi:hypothetical protein